jgi:N-hydroxyarylamine O-acetyltransferase
MDGSATGQPDGGYAVACEEGGLYVLRREIRGTWHDMYACSETPALPVDFEVGNHHTSTHPDSPFLRTLTVQRSERAVRYLLRGYTYAERAGGEERARDITPDEIGDLLRGTFGLDVTEEEARVALGPPAG